MTNADSDLGLESFIGETIRLSRKNGYHPTAFISMRQRYGTVQAISRLVENGDVQSGFKRLHSLGLLEWSIEAAVMKYPNSFATTTKECAAFRLRLARESSRDKQ